MACRLLYLFVACSFLFPTTALAQRGQQALDIILQQAERELQRQQQLEQLQQQRNAERAQWEREMNRRRQNYPADRQACLRGDADACDRAMTSPSLTREDRELFIMQRDALIAARQQRIEVELAEQNRQRQLQAEQDQARQRAIERAERERRQAAETRSGTVRTAPVQPAHAALTTSALPSPTNSAGSGFVVVLLLLSWTAGIVALGAWRDRTLVGISLNSTTDTTRQSPSSTLRTANARSTQYAEAKTMTQPPPLPKAASMPPPIPVSSAVVETIQLKLRRSQKTGMLGGKPTFTLDARVELPPDTRALVAKYQLSGLVVYDSQARRKQQEAAYSHFDDASRSSAGRSLWKSARGLASAAMMAMTLRVTVGGLMSGQHIACKDLDELLGAEAAIVEACRNLKGYLETALTFDGREDLIDI